MSTLRCQHINFMNSTHIFNNPSEIHHTSVWRNNKNWFQSPMPQTKCNTFFSQLRSVPPLCPPPSPISPSCQNPFSLLKATGWFLADKCATFKSQLYHILFVCLAAMLCTPSRNTVIIQLLPEKKWMDIPLPLSVALTSIHFTLK